MGAGATGTEALLAAGGRRCFRCKALASKIEHFPRDYAGAVDFTQVDLEETEVRCHSCWRQWSGTSTLLN